MKKLLLFTMLLPMMVSAQWVNVNGVFYEKKPDGTYKVIKHPIGKYRGDITISIKLIFGDACEVVPKLQLEVLGITALLSHC